MRLRRGAPILLVAGLLTGGITGGVRIGGRAAVGATEAIVALAPARVQSAAATTPAVNAEPVRRNATSVAVPMAAAGTLNADESAVLGETCELRLLADGTGLELDGRQWTALATAALEADAIRQNYEAEIATTVAEGPGKFRIEIPSYAGAGEALRAKFYAQLDRVLGMAAAADVAEKIGARLEARFGGFGISEQTLEVAGDPRAGLADCAVTRTVTYAVDGEGGTRVATRRETILPAWEDSSGERWGALLGKRG